MLPAKEQKAFEKICDVLNGPIDPKRGQAIEKFLKKQGIEKQVKPFFMDCIEELENKVKVWNLPTEKVQKFIDNIPEYWKTSMITDDLLLHRVPEKDWHKYRDFNWVKEHSKMKSAAEVATAAPKVSVTKDKYDSQSGRIAFEVTTETDLSELAESLKGESEEDIESAIEEAFDESLMSELDKSVWNYLRGKHDRLAGSSLELEEKPRALKDLTANTKLVFKLVVSYDPPAIGEEELAEEFSKLLKGMV